MDPPTRRSAGRAAARWWICCLLGLLAAPAIASVDEVSDCAVELKANLNQARPVSVPIGCEIGPCPAGEAGILFVEIAGPAVDGGFLEFDDLPANVDLSVLDGFQPATIGTEGISLSKGWTAVEGIPTGTATPTPWAKVRVEPGATVDLEPGTIAARVRIVQMLGDKIIADHEHQHLVPPCTPTSAALTAPPKGDLLHLSKKRDPQPSTVLIDGQKASACLDDKAFDSVMTGTTTAEVAMGNLVPDAGCSSEAVVFSCGNAMALRDLDGDISASSGDVIPTPLANPRSAKVAVWISREEFRQRASDELAVASSIFASSSSGIVFEVSVALAGALDRPEITCAKRDELMQGPFYEPEAINVYYIPGTAGVPGGVTCKAPANSLQDESNVVLIGSSPYATTLAHEIGHTLSLDHLGQVFGNVTKRNLMRIGDVSGMPRSRIVLGQVFRANSNPGSWIQVLAPRAELVRACTHSANTPDCPPIDSVLTASGPCDCPCPRACGAPCVSPCPASIDLCPVP